MTVCSEHVHHADTIGAAHQCNTWLILLPHLAVAIAVCHSLILPLILAL